jgi:hypothetical protein
MGPISMFAHNLPRFHRRPEPVIGRGINSAFAAGDGGAYQYEQLEEVMDPHVA